jgi:hypothetical protein
MGPITSASGERVKRCARAATDRLQQILGDRLSAAYLIGSGALGGLVLDESDIDLVAVCADTPSAEDKQRIVDALTREAMTWPVRGLEFVLYSRAAVATPSTTPQFAINLNVGPRMPLHVSLDPASEPAHWFVLDLAILRDHGLALIGPPARQLVAPSPRAWLLEALASSLAWHAAHESLLHQTVLNASRAWRYVEDGVWSSKDDAAGWMRSRTEDPSLVEAALAIRHGDRAQGLDPARVDRFAREVQARIGRAALAEQQPQPNR